MPLLRHSGFRAPRDHHHSSGTGAHPAALDRREHLSRQRTGREGHHQLVGHLPEDRRAAETCRAEGKPEGAHHQSRPRQAAARRDRQGPVQGGQAPHSRRADLIAERDGFGGAPRPASRIQGTRHRLDHDLPQAERDRPRRRFHHGAARRRLGLDARLRGRPGLRGRHHPRHGRPLHRGSLPAANPEDRRDGLSGEELDLRASAPFRSQGGQGRLLPCARRRGGRGRPVVGRAGI